jgi:ABC-type multidrug transport system fused ATPase/permease subunit
LSTQNPPKLSNIDLLYRLWSHVGTRRRWQFAAVLVLMNLASLAEILSIGATLPFLAILTYPDRVYELNIAQPFIHFFEFTSPSQLLKPISILFGVLALFAGVLRIVLLVASTRLTFAVGADFSFSMYERMLYQQYSVQVMKNSSEIIAGVSIKSGALIYNTILPVLNLISGGILLFFILIILILMNPFWAILTFGSFTLIYVIIIYFVRNRLLIDGKRVAIESTQIIKYLQEGLGGVRDVLIDGSQSTYCAIYRKADLALRRAQGNTLIISNSPRYGLEAIALAVISALALVLVDDSDGVMKIVPILGAIGLCAQRLMPVLQQSYWSWASILNNRSALEDVLDLLDQPMPEYMQLPPSAPMKFNSEIQAEKISFQYSPESPWVLQDLDLKISKGSKVGFIGETGCGKSTLLDILMGLLEPVKGSIKVDGVILNKINTRAWRSNIAHVPQAIFLSDSSIAENIAFGIPKENIDFDRVVQAAQNAKIAEIIDSWPEKYQTTVGERGVRLSGGQRQRIGIARALYKKASVIIFDEATSALDAETESAVMEAIEGLNSRSFIKTDENPFTILMIAHRLSTLKDCDQIYELRNSGIYCVKSS